MILEFIFGIIIALIVQNTKVILGIYSLFIGILLFLSGIYLSNSEFNLFENHYVLFNRVVLFGVPSFFILLGIISLELNYNIPINKYIVLLGEASYTLYLIHLPLIVAALKILNKLNFKNNWLIYFYLFFLLILVTLLSCFVHLKIEKPLIKLINQRSSKI